METQKPAPPASGSRITRSRIARSPVLPWSLFVLALAGVVVFALLWRGARSADRGRAEVGAVANRFLVALFNYQGETMDANVRDIRAFAVGDFADEVNSVFDQDAIKAFRDAKVKSVGKVQFLVVESVSGGLAKVFGVVNQSFTNVSNPSPRTDVVRLEIDMIDTKAGWKVNRVNILQSPTGTSGPLGTGP